MARLAAGERMSDLCREFGISRKTGYKFLERYKVDGEAGLVDRSRAPQRVARRCPDSLADLVVGLRRKHPTWGAKKLHAKLSTTHPGVTLPSPSTIGAVLKRSGLVTPRRCRREVMRYEAPLREARVPNEVWCADFKGQFRLGTRRYCYPLTVTDRLSRLLLGCEALDGTDEEGAFEAFERVFKEYGLPEVMRTDNGVPFASRGLWGLSKLAIWWLRLGIWPERIAPASPQQNGQHERMHRVLKAETTRPAAANQLQQQERFDAFKEEYNTDRPHEALGQRPPETCYTPSPRRYPDSLPELLYPLHDDVIRVMNSGHVRVGRVTVFLSSCLATQRVGIRELDDDTWQLSFASLDLGRLSVARRAYEPAPSPFGAHIPTP
jgi:transposase InsO family protein